MPTFGYCSRQPCTECVEFCEILHNTEGPPRRTDIITDGSNEGPAEEETTLVPLLVQL